MKRILSSVLALLCVGAAIVSCGESGNNPKTTDNSGTESQKETEETSEYPFEVKDFENAELRILNVDELWSMYVMMDFDKTTGVPVDDAVYTRNRKVEEDFNCVISEKKYNNTSGNVFEYTDFAMKEILGGDDNYDVMYLPMNVNASLITDGYLQNLLDIKGVDFTAEWWDQDVIKSATYKDSLYFASNCAHLMVFDCMWGLYFNQKMMNDLDLEYPYQLVKDGKWTIEKLGEYAKTAANLNGDESFAWNKNNNAIYGVSGHNACVDRFIYAAGGRYVEQGEDGDFVFAADSDRMQSIAEKLADLLKQSNGTGILGASAGGDADKGGYVYIFQNSRSMFLCAEVSAAQGLRTMDDEYGFVPFPKFDESQTSYNVPITMQCFMFTIPTTCKNPERAAQITDVLSYESYKSVLPVYYGERVEQKGLRNENSIEMLNLMRQNRGIDISTTLGWSLGLYQQITNMVFNGDSAIASYVEANKSSIMNSAKAFKDAMEAEKE